MAFDLESNNRAPLVGSTGTWKSLGMHQWHALVHYGMSKPKVERRVVSWPEADRQNWMFDRLRLRGVTSVPVTDVFGNQLVINDRIVNKILANATRTPYVPYAGRCLRDALEVWENAENDKNELRRYYLMAQNSEDPDQVGMVAVCAKDDVTGEQVVFNVIPMTASYANNIRKGVLRYIAYVDNVLCVHGCCDSNVSGFAKMNQLRSETMDLKQRVQSLKKAEQGLKNDVQALRARREKEKAALEEMQAQIAVLLADQEQ